jgi:hypothetical protein
MPLRCTQTSGAEEVEKGLPLLLTEPVVQEGLAGNRGTEQSFPALRTAATCCLCQSSGRRSGDDGPLRKDGGFRHRR